MGLTHEQIMRFAPSKEELAREEEEFNQYDLFQGDFTITEKIRKPENLEENSEFLEEPKEFVNKFNSFLEDIYLFRDKKIRRAPSREELNKLSNLTDEEKETLKDPYIIRSIYISTYGDLKDYVKDMTYLEAKKILLTLEPDYINEDDCVILLNWCIQRKLKGFMPYK